MVRAVGSGFARKLFLALASLPAAAQNAPPPATPGNNSMPWNTGTTPPAPGPPEDASALSLRVYRDPARTALLPYQHGAPAPDDRAYAVDVSAVMTRCPDGNLVITALVIGGRLTPLETTCRSEPGTVRAETPACDARSWNCTTEPAR